MAAEKKDGKKTAASKKPAKKKPAKKKPAKKKPAKKKPAKPTGAARKKRAAGPGAPEPGPHPEHLDRIEATPPHEGAARPGRARPPGEHGERSGRWAACVTLTDAALNDAAAVGLGDGVEMDPVTQQLTLPAMGEVTLRLALTVTAVRFELRSGDDNRARVTVLGRGDVEVHGSESAPTGAGGLGMPEAPAPLPVALTTLTDPYVEVHDDHTVSLGLDLRQAELVRLDVDRDALVPDGVDPEAWAGVLQMTSMMFTMMGPQLFDGLRAEVPAAGVDLGGDVGAALVGAGVAVGRAEVQVTTGMLLVGLPASEAVEGSASPVPVAGSLVGIGLAGSVVDHLSDRLLASVLGGLPLPFEVDIQLGEQSIGSRIRQTRLSERLPDLRSSVRTDVAIRLVGGRLEVALTSAWVELPPLVPGIVNSVNRRLGGLAAMAPLRFRFPAEIPLPVEGVPIAVRIDDVRVATTGLGVAVAVA